MRLQPINFEGHNLVLPRQTDQGRCQKQTPGLSLGHRQSTQQANSTQGSGEGEELSLFGTLKGTAGGLYLYLSAQAKHYRGPLDGCRSLARWERFILSRPPPASSPPPPSSLSFMWETDHSASALAPKIMPFHQETGSLRCN